MQITRHRPVTRGVTELMYVGDDGASALPTQHPALLVLAGGAALVAIFAKKPAARAIGGAVAALSWYAGHGYSA